METLEDCIEVNDDGHHKRLDAAAGIGLTYGAMFSLSGTFYSVTQIGENPIVGTLATVGFLALSFISLTASCYFFTPPSQRGDFREKHPWVGKRLTNYLRK